jgi:glyoxylase-like metal-dependent hydrolase (beta-lactamase superfamily II)
MIFKQYRYEPLNQASYLLGCYRKGIAFIVDPLQELGVAHYQREARSFALSIRGVLETHIPADYVSCARELAEASYCPHYLHGDAPAAFEFESLEDDQILELGNVRVRVLHTPGHTPEHVAFLVTDVTRGDDPWAVLTGDSLLVGDVGRPDLLVGEQAARKEGWRERSMLQFTSIRDRLLSLPDHVEVYPGHYGRSTCGGINMSGKASSTVWFEKKYNLPMRQPNKEIFAEFVRDTSKALPEGYQRIKKRNLGLEESDADAGEAGPE